MKNYYDFKEYESYYGSREINKEKVILHSDLNNFFASVESLFLEGLEGVPVAVCGDKAARHGIVLAKNEFAKKFGVKTGDTISKAKEKCPSLITRACHHSDYLAVSNRVQEIYLSYATRVEAFGIDESWIDISELAKRKNKNNVFLSGYDIAEEIRERVKKETGLTVSIGVSFNKTFSKLASDMKKPDAVTIISYDDFKEKIWRLRVENLLFVGRRTRDELNRLKIETVGELARSDRSYLKAILGKSGESLWDIANGFDFSAVSLFGEREIQKSISQSTTLPYDVTTYEEADSVLNTLCYNVSRELKSKSYYTSRLKLFVKFYDFSSFVRQVKMPLPTTNHEDIMLYASELFKSNVDFIKPVRSIGIGAEDLRDCVDEQIPLVIQETDSALESVISKYTIQRASTLKNRKLCEIDSKHICFENAR